MPLSRIVVSAFGLGALVVVAAWDVGTGAHAQAPAANAKRASVANPITGEGLPNPAPVVTRNWGQLPAGRKWGTTAGIRTSQFWNIGAGLDGDLPLRPWASELRARRVADNSKDNPDAHCLPIGLTQLHNHPQPRKIIQTPSLIVMLYESNGGVRQIFMDGRTLPNNDPQPWWYGYSVGKWDGDTLVVETNGFRDGGWLDVNGAPLTDAANMTERFRRVNYGNLEIDVTVDDPKAYTRAWTAKTVRQRLMADDELIEFVCAENEKSSAHYK